MKSLRTKFYFLLLVVTAGLWVNGCKTPDPENAAARPWNNPRGWETGLPSAINEGR